MTTANQAALARAIKQMKTQAGLAEAIGTTQSLVGYWLNKSKRGVPAEWVLRVEAASGVSRHELRPDLYPPQDSPRRRKGSVRKTADRLGAAA